MIEYRGTLKEALKAVFEDHPDCLVVMGVSRYGAPKLKPQDHAARPTGYVNTTPDHYPNGVIVNEKQMDDLEMYYIGRFSTNLRNILNVYDRNTDPDLLPLQTY
jgi:hypothetical protein